MTVDNDTARTDAIGNGSTDTYPFHFRILDESELLVITTDDGESTTLVLDTDYTVSGVGDDEGEIVLVDGNLGSGITISMTRDMDFTQPIDLSEQGSFSMEDIEEAMDRLTMQMQQVKEANDRGLRLSAAVSPDDVSTELPAPEAGKVLAWDAEEERLENIDPGSVALAIPADGSVTMDKLVDFATGTILSRIVAGTGKPVRNTLAAVKTALALDPDASTIETAGSTIRLKDGGTTFAKLAADLISGMTGETAIATGDYLSIHDASANAPRKMLITDVLKIINALTADASPDVAADYVVTYDASASAVKKVLLSALSASLTAATTSAAGIIELATNAEVQTGSDTTRAVVPSAQKYHQSACKAWVKFTGTSGAILDSFGVSSVTDAGVGKHTLNWTTSFGNANYATVGSSSGTTLGVDECGIVTVDYVTSAPSTSSSRLLVLHGGGTFIDASFVMAAAFGDL